MDDQEKFYLKDVEFPESSRKVYEALLHGLGPNVTLQMIAQMTDEELLNLPSFGLRKLYLLRQILSESSKLISIRKSYSSSNIDYLTTTTLKMEELKDERLSSIIPRVTEQKYKVLLSLLVSYLGKYTSLQEIRNMSDDELLKIPNLGRLKLDRLKQLLAEYDNQTLSFDDMGSSDKLIESSLSEEQLKAPTTAILLPNKLNHLLGIIVAAYKNILTIEDLLKLDINELRKLAGFGKSKIERFKKLQVDIAAGQYVIESVKQQGDEDSSQALEAYPLVFVEKTLENRIDNFVRELSERDRYIFTHRLGFNCKKKTLEEVAQTLPEGQFTRERARQIESSIINSWRSSCGLAPTRLWFTLQEYLVLDEVQLFPNLYSQFTDNKGFYRFLAMTCGRPEGELWAVINPPLPLSTLNSFWLENPSGSPLQSLVDHLKDQHSYDDAIAKNIIYRAKQEERLKVVGGLVVPCKATKPLAVINTLLDYEHGAKWEDIQAEVNSRGISESNMPSNRLDGSFKTAVDTGYVYQSGRGVYCHTKYLEIDDDTINAVLADVEIALNKSKLEGRKALHLMTDYYRNNKTELDYFVVRHIVRSEGVRLGIFFTGKSGADTISLDPDFSQISQLRAIEEYIEKSKNPVSKDDVAKMIRSGSVGHAAFYLDQLTNSEKVVFVGDGKYGHVNNVYDNTDIAQIIRASSEFLVNESRILDIAILAKRLNRKLGFKHDKYFYFGLLKVFAKEYGKEWFFGSYCVATRALEFYSISAAARHFIEQGIIDSNELLAEIDRYFLFEPTTAKLAISNMLNMFRRELKSSTGVDGNTSNIFDDLSDGRQSKKEKLPAYQSLSSRQLRLLNRFLDRELSSFTPIEGVIWLLRLLVLRYLELNNLSPLGTRFILPADETAQVELIQHAFLISDELKIERLPLEIAILNGDDESAFKYLFHGYLTNLRAPFGALFDSDSIQWLLNSSGSLTKTDSILRQFSIIISDEQAESLRVFDDLYHWVKSHIFGSRAHNQLNKYVLEHWVESDREKWVSEAFEGNPRDLKVLVWPSAGGIALSKYFDVLTTVYRKAGYKRRQVVAEIIKNNLFGKSENELDLLFTQATLTLTAVRFDLKVLESNVCSSLSIRAYPDYEQADFEDCFDRLIANIDHEEIASVSDELVKRSKTSGKVQIQSTKFVLTEPNLEYWRQRLVLSAQLSELLVTETSLGITIQQATVAQSDSLDVQVHEYLDRERATSEVIDGRLFLNLPNTSFSIFSDTSIIKYFALESRRLGDFCHLKTESLGLVKDPKSHYWFELHENPPSSNFDGWYLASEDFVSVEVQPLQIIDASKEIHLGTVNKLQSLSLFINTKSGLKTSLVNQGIYYSHDTGRILELNNSTLEKADTVESWLLLDIFHKFLSVAQLTPVDSVAPSIVLKLPIPPFHQSELFKNFKDELSRQLNRREISPLFEAPIYLIKKGVPISTSFGDTLSCDIKRLNDVYSDLEQVRIIIDSQLDLSKFNVLSGGVIKTPFLEGLYLDNYDELRRKLLYRYACSLISYGVGSILGRYKPCDQQWGDTFTNIGFLPLTDDHYFEHDAAKQIYAWLRSTIGEQYIEESWNTLNRYLSPNDISSSAVREYINNKFYLDHRSDFKNRPIYWRITSGIHRAFQCLVYVHRFDEATIPKMRLDFLQPLIHKYNQILEQLPIDQENASSIKEKLLIKDRMMLLKLKIAEAKRFDETLKYAADKRFSYNPNLGVAEQLRLIRRLGINVM